MKCLVNIVGFNRPEHFRKTIEAIETEIKRYQGQMEIEVSVIIDGIRDDDSRTDSWEKVIKIGSSSHFPVSLRQKNFGLRENIFLIISEFKKSKYDTMILIEDDIVLSRGVFSYFEEMFLRYKSDSNVFQVSGFSPLNLNDVSIFRHFRLSTWAWGVWRHKIPEVDSLIINWDTFDIGYWMEWHGAILRAEPDLKRMFKYQKFGKINSWSLDFLIYMINNNLHTIYPTISLIINIGHDGTGVNCRKSTFFPKDIGVNLLQNREIRWSMVNERSLPTYKEGFKKYYTPNIFIRMSRFVYDVINLRKDYF